MWNIMSENRRKMSKIHYPLPCKILDNKNAKLQCNQYFYVISSYLQGESRQRYKSFKHTK